jgi:hypothetical protein
MRFASIVIMTAISAFTAGSAAAEEKPVQLRQAPGLDKVEAHCSACHSLDYVQMNSPFLSATGWDAEVAKMVNAFGARIGEADVRTIADYLNKNYGMRRLRIESSSLGEDKSLRQPTSSSLKATSPRVAVRTSNPAPAKRTSLHRNTWACSGLNRLIFGSSCSRRPAFAWSARHWPLVLN